MQTKRKKFWIVFTCVFLSLIVLCSVFAIVFRLKTVDVEFRAVAENTNLQEGTIDKVRETGEFDFGKNILFMNFEDNIQKIEKSNPYIKVEQIVRHFPNIVRVYISERIPKYRVKESSESVSKWYIMDNDFKILDKVTEEELESKKVCGKSNYFDQTIEITKETMTLKSDAVIGEFVADETREHLARITSGIYGKTKDFTVIRSIDYSKVNETFTLTMRNEALEEQKGCVIKITGTNNLYDKALAGAVCFVDGQIVDDTLERIENIPSVTVSIYEDAAGKYYAIAS
jgi:hypothetical protein